jgi:sulfane dehydrogenase subunit SoxC
MNKPDSARSKEETMSRRDRPTALDGIPAVAGGGLLDRRTLFRTGAAAAAGGGLAAAAQATPLNVETWMREPGAPFVAYGQPSHFENKIVKVFTSLPGTTGTGSARTPLQALEGTITPNGLHFERAHDGIPDIDPDAHQLVIHGLVKRALSFNIDTLSRYPMVSRVAFIECGGNGALLYQKTPAQLPLQGLHGLLSCAEWTGVPLSVLLDEAGVDPSARWVLAEGGDAASMSRSVPLGKAMDDAIVALYQNGERVRPGNGYPMRLLLPGFEGNMQVKWLRRLKLTTGPMMTKDETSKYTITLPDGKTQQFVFPMEAKSVITRPSPGHKLDGAGIFEISGLAWSGYGKVAKVDVSADGGKSWAPTALQEPVLSMALTRFRLPWRWDGGPAVLQSRVTDESGFVQPSRNALLAERGARTIFHYNGITSWGVSPTGELNHVYA